MTTRASTAPRSHGSRSRASRTHVAVPKISFGKFIKDGDRTLLPFSVEVHHSLMDGLHVGRYIARIEELLAEPETFLD
jgi:chloramphenicol O-acetyltransferase type A